MRVYQALEEGEDAAIPDADRSWDGGDLGKVPAGRRVLVSLVLKLPEYRWH